MAPLRRSFCREAPSHWRLCTGKALKQSLQNCTEKPFHTHTHMLFHAGAFTHKRIQNCTEKLLHRQTSAYSSFYIQELLRASTLSPHRLFCPQTPLCTEALMQGSILDRCRRLQGLQAEMLWHREAFAQQSFYTEEPLHRAAFTHRSLDTQRFCTEQALHKQPLRAVTFTLRRLATQWPLNRAAFTQGGGYKQMLLHTDLLLHTDAFTQRLCAGYTLHREDLHSSFYPHGLLHTNACTQRGSHIFFTETFTHRNIHAKQPLHPEVFTPRGFHKQTRLHKKTVAESFDMQTHAHRPYNTGSLLHRRDFTLISCCPGTST